MISQNDDPGRFGRDVDLFKVGGRQGRPDGQAGTRGHHRQPRLNAFAKSEDAVCADFRQTHSTACNLAQHHARLCDIGLDDSVGGVINLQIGSMYRGGGACVIADDADQRRKSGLGLPMGQVGMEPDIRTIRNGQSATHQKIGGGAIFDGFGMGQNEGDFTGRIPIGCRCAGGLLSRR